MRIKNINIIIYFVHNSKIYSYIHIKRFFGILTNDENKRQISKIK